MHERLNINIMGQEIIKYVKPDKHTYYMSCAQYADWVVQAFCDEAINAFIVQEIYLNKELDGIKATSHYYEAWRVVDGECKKEPGQDSHDLFCIGHPLNDGDALKESIGHRGKIAFIPRVFLVKEGSSLYDEIQLWPTNVVHEANGLHAYYYTEELSNKIYRHPEFKREPFFHEWEFDDPKRIYDVVLQYCITMYHQDSKIDRTNFYSDIENFFSEDKYSDIKRQIIDAWEAR